MQYILFQTYVESATDHSAEFAGPEQLNAIAQYCQSPQVVYSHSLIRKSTSLSPFFVLSFLLKSQGALGDSLECFKAQNDVQMALEHQSTWLSSVHRKDPLLIQDHAPFCPSQSLDVLVYLLQNGLYLPQTQENARQLLSHLSSLSLHPTDDPPGTASHIKQKTDECLHAAGYPPDIRFPWDPTGKRAHQPVNATAQSGSSRSWGWWGRSSKEEEKARKQREEAERSAAMWAGLNHGGNIQPVFPTNLHRSR